VKFRASKVIVSVPLSAMKSSTIKSTPSLPKEKLRAIEKMGVGNICRILIEFDKSITTSKQHYFTVISDNPEDSGLMTYFMNLAPFINKPIVMIFGLAKPSDLTKI
jgi:monoamine oxidase